MDRDEALYRMPEVEFVVDARDRGRAGARPARREAHGGDARPGA
jgi:hypothetical protein